MSNICCTEIEHPKKNNVHAAKAYIRSLSKSATGKIAMYHIRRKEQEIADVDEMKKVLASTQYVTIALCKDNEPYLVTLSHGYDAAQNCIFFHCATEGKKLDYIKANTRVWGQALTDERYTDAECRQHYTSVQFYGEVTFISKADDKIRALACMIQQQNQDPKPMMAKLEKLDPKTDLNNVLIGRIDIEYLSGKQSEKQS